MSQAFELKKEKSELRSKWTNKFLGELEGILEKCFLQNQTKKEQFITREKIEIELIKLLQSQKRFQAPADFNFKMMGIFDAETSLIGRVKTINVETNTVEFISICGETKTKRCAEVTFFDTYSIAMQAMFEKQSKFYDSYNFRDTFSFLTHVEKPANEKTKKQQTQRYGVLCNDSDKTKLTVRVDYGKY